MAIYTPGQRFRRHRVWGARSKKKSVVVSLSLTAFVDMFTVLVIFLLQNYNTTGEILYLPKEIELPKASEIKELKPSLTVAITEDRIEINGVPVVRLSEIPADVMVIESVKSATEKQLALMKEAFEKDARNQIRMAYQGTNPENIELEWNKATVLADRNIPFQNVRRVLFSITEAGAREINFAVMKEKQ